MLLFDLIKQRDTAMKNIIVFFLQEFKFSTLFVCHVVADRSEQKLSYIRRGEILLSWLCNKLTKSPCCFQRFRRSINYGKNALLNQKVIVSIWEFVLPLVRLLTILK